MWLQLSALTLFAVQVAYSDVYLQNPRGSNNRLDERGRERANANRMFDSQNNNRGGYNVGSLYYYQGSDLAIEWTNQHSCGEKNAHCELVVQYMCDNQLRDGAKTTTIPERRSQCANADCNSDLEYGMNENYDYYMNCKYRERNKGLFTADQNLNNENTAKNTRQNPKGKRRGYECPEERDYYPYWQPTPWKDIATITNNMSRCEQLQSESQNVKSKFSCVPPPGYIDHLIQSGVNNNQGRKLLPLTKAACEQIKYPANSNDPNSTARWVETKAWGLPAPACLDAKVVARSRDNHNGNGPGAFPNMYNWTIFDTPNEHCALRLRYNISTGDYNAYETTAANNTIGNAAAAKIDIGSLVGLNEADATDRGYVFKNNPEVNPLKGNNKLELQLAINTAQYGRTFQDRSHSFAIRARPASLENTKIHNLNVRGKRGNIVQVYPAVEYDFVPNRLMASVGDHIHFQWTGSNTNPGNNDGQGLAGTDRSNVLLLTPQNYPEGTPGKAVAENLKFGQLGNNYPAHLNTVNLLGLPKQDLINLAVLTPGQLRGELSELDDAGTYFDLPPRKITSAGTYHYMSTRNNNFSNRSQKGKIVVSNTKFSENLVGWSGAAIMLDDGEGVWIQKAAITSEPKIIRIEEWEQKAGEEVVKSKGGDVNVGDDYASKFLVVYPFKDLADGNKVTIKLKVDSSSANVYHSLDYKNWDKVSNVKIVDNLATFETRKGGAYIGRTSSSSTIGVVVGVVVGGLVVVVLVVGIIIFCRKNPEVVEQFRMATKSKV